MTKLMTCLVRCESALQSVAMAANQLGWDDHVVLEVRVIKEEKDVLEVELWGNEEKQDDGD